MDANQGYSVDGLYTVTGVYRDFPQNSSYKFQWMSPYVVFENKNDWMKPWGNNLTETLVELNPSVDPERINKKLAGYLATKTGVPSGECILFSMNDWNLRSQFTDGKPDSGNIKYVKLFSLIAAIILIIACINFMNLSTARSAKRAKEVGMRKVFGSYRSHLVQQFLGESMLLSCLALVLAFGLLIVLLPVFNSFSGKEFSASVFFDAKVIFLLAGVTFLVGLVSGTYPALFLSAFEPTQVLKGTFSPGRKSKLFRQSLVVLQFAISLALIISTVIIYRQLEYLRSADLGFNKEQILVMPVRPPMAASYVPFAEELRTGGRIKNIASMNDVLGASHNTHEYNYEGMPQNKQWIYFPSLIVSPDFIKTLDIKLVAGRAFDRNIKTDDSLSVIINESMVKHLGWGTPQNALGKQFFTPSGSERVIGVAKDFNFVSLKETVGPFVLDMADKKNRLFWTKFIVIRIPAEDVKGTIKYVETKWNEFSKEYPFDYFFLDENLGNLYKSQDKLAKLVGYFSGLAIFIACLGLFALASFTAEQRTKEIGIRKVLGAPVYTIVRLMSKEFLKLVFISAIISWPLTWFLMNNWLNNFAYRIQIGAGVFIFSAIAGLVIALATVLFHSLRSAYSNPVKALKYE